MNRTDAIDQFLAASGWGGARRTMLAGDASFRKYERVFLGEKSAVLMDAPPDKEDIRPFMKAAEYLTQTGLSAPQILASDEAHGFLLLEDLGDDLFARVMEKHPETERELYLAATEVLVTLYKDAKAGGVNPFEPFSIEKMLQQVALLPEWFMPFVSGASCPEEIKQEYLDIWRRTLAKLPALQQVTVIYDYHAENLLWLPGREGVAKAGLLDFQDAMLGSPAYDLVSILEDVRRDITSDTVQHALDYYLEKTGIAREEFMAAYHMMGAQRNCRIAGTFARLYVRDHKPRYLTFMPRVWRLIEKDVSHPLMAEVRQWLDTHIKREWRQLRVAA
ncbi:MAG TPA: phosphotransferase [Rickettsiales bacterium]|nr:phosphotransferase [Rickettsiales bacterium]